MGPAGLHDILARIVLVPASTNWDGAVVSSITITESLVVAVLKSARTYRLVAKLYSSTL